MIKRETYLSRIRPFIGNELIKVLTGIRRSGKSVMLSLIQDELVESGVNRGQFIFLNFENMSNVHLCTSTALHDEIIRRANEIDGKVYPFLVIKIGSCSLCAILEISVVLRKSLIGIISGIMLHSFL